MTVHLIVFFYVNSSSRATFRFSIWNFLCVFRGFFQTCLWDSSKFIWYSLDGWCLFTIQFLKMFFKEVLLKMEFPPGTLPLASSGVPLGIPLQIPLEAISGTPLENLLKFLQSTFRFPLGVSFGISWKMFLRLL